MQKEKHTVLVPLGIIFFEIFFAGFLLLIVFSIVNYFHILNISDTYDFLAFLPQKSDTASWYSTQAKEKILSDFIRESLHTTYYPSTPPTQQNTAAPLRWEKEGIVFTAKTTSLFGKVKSLSIDLTFDTKQSFYPSIANQNGFAQLYFYLLFKKFNVDRQFLCLTKNSSTFVCTQTITDSIHNTPTKTILQIGFTKTQKTTLGFGKVCTVISPAKIRIFPDPCPI